MGTALQSQTQRTQSERPPAAGTDAFQRYDSLTERFAIPIGVFISLVAFLRYSAYGTRRLWYDEISTIAVALQPSWVDVWNAFAAGVDAQPPFFSYVTRISWLLLGRNELALRIPEILGILLFSWCMFFFVGRRLGAVFGLSAMILPLMTDLELYAGEARPYGMLLGTCGLAMLAWRHAIESPKRRLALPLFAISLALVVGTHAYAVIVIVVFALAELFRCIWTRKADFPLWLCFLAVLPPLSLYWFPMQVGKTGGGVLGPSEWAHWNAVPAFYVYFFHNRLLVPVFTGMLAVGLAFLRNGPKQRVPGMPWHETVLSAFLAISPVFSVALAVFVTKYYRPRYSIFAIAGLAILTILLTDAVAPNRRTASFALLFVSVSLFGIDGRYVQFDRDAMKKRDAQIEVPYGSVPPNMPLVIASGLAMLPADKYASDADVARTYYLIDLAASIKYTGSTFFDWDRPAFKKYYHFRAHLDDYSSFVRQHKKFWVYGPYSYSDDWQVQKLQDDGAKIVEKGRYSGIFTDNFLLEVELP
jgi:hypothetical protein